MLERVAGCLIQDFPIERFVIPLACQIWGIGMGKPHPVELRSRVIAFVDEEHGHREAARHFGYHRAL